MLEQIILLSQSLSVGLIAAWLSLGLRDNIMHPSLNETYTAEVMEMTRMKEAFPEEYAQVAYRAVTSRAIQKLAFRLIVLAELAAVLLLWAGAGALFLALTGLMSTETATALALAAAMLFTAIWAGFLVVGNYFLYWFCHEDAQNTHYQMTLWGLGTMIFLAVA